jgi:ribonuclease P protein component
MYRSTLPYARVGIIVPKSVDKRAVVRNRIRRTFMNAVQKNIPAFPVADYIIMITPHATPAPKKELEKIVTEVFTSLSHRTYPT